MLFGLNGQIIGGIIIGAQNQRKKSMPLNNLVAVVLVAVVVAVAVAVAVAVMRLSRCARRVPLRTSHFPNPRGPKYPNRRYSGSLRQES